MKAHTSNSPITGENPTPLNFSKAVLIYNPAARRLQGRLSHQLQTAVNRIRSFDIEVNARPTARPNHASCLAQESLERGCDLIIACGGDGTVNEVISGMAGSRVPLMVIPAGTANVLAKEIGLPLNFVESTALLKTGLIRRIALGRVDSRPFALMAGIGVDASVLSVLNEGWKKNLGEGAFWIAALQQLFDYSFPQFEVQIEGESQHATFAVIGRAKNYGGGFQITGRADLFSEAFHVCLFQSSNRWRYLSYLWRVLRKQHYDLPDVLHLKARSVLISGSQEIQVQVDGELIGRLPQSVTIQPDALSLLIPGPTDSGSNP